MRIGYLRIVAVVTRGYREGGAATAEGRAVLIFFLTWKFPVSGG